MTAEHGAVHDVDQDGLFEHRALQGQVVDGVEDGAEPCRPNTMPYAEEGERESAGLMFGRTPFWGLVEHEPHQDDDEHAEQRQHVEVGERDEVVDLVAEVVEVELAARPGQALDVLLGDGGRGRRRRSGRGRRSSRRVPACACGS